MVTRADLDCRPYVPYTPYVHDDGTAPTILYLAARAASAADEYASAIDDRADYRTLLMLGMTSARRTRELTTAITDRIVETDDDRLTR